MKPEKGNELSKMTADMIQASILLNCLVQKLEATKQYRDVPEQIMDLPVDAQEELDTAIERYCAAHDDWVAASGGE
jgi:hypothetical protein